jgi:bifunctional UDP-N-acetylglucosamine pyrophosphorylase/glucosamine-1-phosphate N-acetyltransferase
VQLGPYCHLRNGSLVQAGAKMGNFVEMKKSVLGRGSKAMHLSYIGDATVGRKVNIGAGTITCNYDGMKKNPTCIGDNVFIGSGTELVAPLTVHSDSYVAAGSTITEDVPRYALAVARQRQKNIAGWVLRKKKK